MAEVLSQNEIDQLLSGISSGEIEEDQLTDFQKNREVLEYDFRRPNRVSKDQLKTIRTLHESFSEVFGFYLANKLQTMATIDLIAVDQLRYSEYVLSISNPSCIYIFSISNSEGRAVLELTPELVLVIVERLLGGSGVKVKTSRGITTIEQRMIKPLMEKALQNLASAWKPIEELEFSLTGFESNPDFVQIAPASEIVIVVSFEIKIGEDSFLMNLCYPSFALEEVIARLNVQYFSNVQSPKDKEKVKSVFSEHLNRTELEVRAILGKSEITVKDLLELQKGDVLVLDTPVDGELPVFVKGRHKLYGKPGVSDGNIAVKVTGFVEE
ncbi:MAG: flagellar motor switch protein FliM [Calditrichia bacterium]